MKMRLLYVFATSILLSSCGKAFLQDNAQVRFEMDTETIQAYAADNNLTLQADPLTGIYYTKTLENPTGRSADLTYLKHLAYDLRVLKGIRVDSKVVADSAIFNYYNSSVIDGFVGAVLLLREGEKGTFFIQSPLAYGQNPPGDIPVWAIMKLELEAVEYFSEADRINNYIARNGITVDSLAPDGTRIIYTERSGSGDRVKVGDAVEVSYTGRFLNQEVFDSGSLTASIGADALIAGFENGLTAFEVGDKGTLIFPSALGYGENGNSSILPFTPLIFEVEIIKKL